MAMQSLKNAAKDRAPARQQPLPTVNVCWDSLFEFLLKLFKPKAQKPLTVTGRYTGLSSDWQQVLTYKVPNDFELELDMLSINCDNWAVSTWRVVIVKADQLTSTGRKFLSALTFSWGNVKIHSEQEIAVYVKSDGATTINADAILSGKEIYLG